MLTCGFQEDSGWFCFAFSNLSVDHLIHIIVVGEKIIEDQSNKGSTMRQVFVLVAVVWFSILLPDYFRSGSDGKVSAYNEGDLGLIPGSGRFPWRRKWHPTPVFLPEESHGRRSLVGYSSWGHKESDMAERLHFHFSN